MVKQHQKDGSGEVAGKILINFMKKIYLLFVFVFCSDNLRFGLQFSRKFVDGSEPNRRPDNFKTTKQKRIWADRLKMNLHNNEIGRQVSMNCLFLIFWFIFLQSS
jgi:hypothetical protein